MTILMNNCRMTPEMEIESPFSLGRGRCFRWMLYFYGKPWILGSGLLLLAGVVCGLLLDVRWFLSALLVLFAGVPMVCLFVYYYYGLNRECYLNVFPHTLRITDMGMVVRIYFPAFPAFENEEDVRDGADEAAGDEVKETGSGENDSSEAAGARTVEYGEIREFEYPFSDLSNVIVGNKEAIFPVLRPAKGFIWIPESAFGEPAEFRVFVEELVKRVGDSCHRV